MAATARCFTKRLRSLLLAACLVFPRPGLAAPTGPDNAPYCIESFERLNSDYLGLSRGSLVNISLPETTGPDGVTAKPTTQAYFVGTLRRWSVERTYIFVEKDSGIVFSMKGVHLEGMGELNPEPLPRVSPQIGGTCAVFSTFTGLQFLMHLGHLNDHTKYLVTRRPVDLLEALMRTPINAAVHEHRRERLSHREKHIFPSQIQFRLKVLEELGVDAKLTNQAASVKEHLEKGLPVILDLRIRRAIDRTLRYQSDGKFVIDEPLGHKIDEGQRPDRYVGRHSVLAVGFIPYGPFKGKLLVLDSADGAAHLWEYSDLEVTPQMRATLLGPNDRVNESELQAKVVDFWKGNHNGKLIVGGAGIAGLLGTGAYLLSGEDEKEKKKQEDEAKRKMEEAEQKAKETEAGKP